MAQRRSSLGPLQHVTDAGRTLMPAFDKLANTLIGDNPALTQALRWALVCTAAHDVHNTFVCKNGLPSSRYDGLVWLV